MIKFSLEEHEIGEGKEKSMTMSAGSPLLGVRVPAKRKGEIA